MPLHPKKFHITYTTLIKFSEVVYVRNENNYVITANYSKDKESFKSIVEKHIKNLVKIPTKHWQLKENSIKYKQSK